jgi:hypothetical protein
MIGLSLWMVPTRRSVNTSSRCRLAAFIRIYGVGHNELLIARALRDRRDQALLFLKFGGD